jgi:PPOX class probable F420-dependent enzyme
LATVIHALPGCSVADPIESAVAIFASREKSATSVAIAAADRCLAYHRFVSNPSPTDVPSAPSPTLAIPADVRAFLDDTRYAVLGTINPDGSVHQTVTWYLIEGDELIVNGKEGRRWTNNLRRDPRLSIAVEAAVDWLQVRGTVEIVDEPAQALADISAMARRYDEHGTADEDIATFRTQRRVSFRLRPSSIHAELEGE